MPTTFSTRFGTPAANHFTNRVAKYIKQEAYLPDSDRETILKWWSDLPDYERRLRGFIVFTMNARNFNVADLRRDILVQPITGNVRVVGYHVFLAERDVRGIFTIADRGSHFLNLVQNKSRKLIENEVHYFTEYIQRRLAKVEIPIPTEIACPT